MDEEVRVIGVCAECGSEVTDDTEVIFVDSEGNYFDSVDCLTEYFNVARLEG